MIKFALIDITQCGQKCNKRPWSIYYFHLWVSIIGNHILNWFLPSLWSLEKEMATHSSILARERSLVGWSPWTPKRVGHYLATKQQQQSFISLGFWFQSNREWLTPGFPIWLIFMIWNLPSVFIHRPSSKLSHNCPLPQFHLLLLNNYSVKKK